MTQQLDTNLAVFRRLVARACRDESRGRLEAAALRAESAGNFATWRHTGLFASSDLEALLQRLGSHVADLPGGHRDPGRAEATSVLHVATRSREIGGLSRLMWRWIAWDGARRHSVVLTRQGTLPVPASLRQAVAESGGGITVLDESSGGFLDWAARLRALATTADLVVVHADTEDVVPPLAFADGHDHGPVVFVNHADHAFWVGASMSDVVLHLRRSGARLSEARRGVPADRCLVLPTPLEPVRRTLPRQEAKRRLGLPADAVLLLSVARPPKFRSQGGAHFVDLHAPVLEREPRAHLWAVGAEDGPAWAAAGERFRDRVRAVEQTPDTSLFLQAADVYVDSYPIVSITSLLEAAGWGLPVATLEAYGDDAAVLCTDAPGLEGTLVAARTPEDYAAALRRLVADPELRAARGEAAREQVERLHTGEGWRQRLDDVYDRVLALGARPALPLRDRRSTGLLDRSIPGVYGKPVRVRADRRLRVRQVPAVRGLAELPPPRRAASWLRLRRTYPGVEARLLAPGLRAALHGVRRRVGHPARRLRRPSRNRAATTRGA